MGYSGEGIFLQMRDAEGVYKTCECGRRGLPSIRTSERDENKDSSLLKLLLGSWASPLNIEMRHRRSAYIWVTQ